MEDLGFVHVYRAPATPGAPTLLLLHGTGGSEHDLLPLAPMLDEQAAVLSPRGKVLERGMPRFFRRLAEGVFDVEDVKFRAEELADFVAAAAARYGFDPGRVIAVGFSNGANIAASVLLLRPHTLRAAILFSPMVPLEPAGLPDLAGVDVFMSAGRRDPIVPPGSAQRLADVLEQSGASVALRWTDGGHSLARGDIEAAGAWLSKLGGASST